MNRYNNVERHKIKTPKLVAFSYINNKHAETEIRKTIPFTISKISKGKGSPGSQSPLQCKLQSTEKIKKVTYYNRR